MAFLFAKSFPFCVQESDNQTGDGTDYPFEMTLEDAMELYWKFLSLKIADNLVYSFIQGGVSSCVATHSFLNTIETLSYWPSKMSEMICPPPPYFYGITSGSNGSITSTSAAPRNTTGYYSLSYSGEIITKKINNTYKFYPAFLFEISTELEYGSSYSTKNNGGLASQIVTLKTSSKEYKTNLYVNSPLGHTATSLSGSVVIEKASDRTPE